MEVDVLRFSLFFLTLIFFFSALAVNLPNFVDLVEKHGASVVNVRALPAVAENKVLPLSRSPSLEDLLRFFESLPDAIPEENALGSGFIISEDGYIVTNHHVVARAEKVLVTLTDRREFTATVVGSDARSDLALLKINSNTPLPTVRFGKSDDLQVGEWVLAIGSPFGFENTATVGIVSALNRSLPDENYVPFIQTDVAINPGNSGGPLFNTKGEVVGVNSQIYSQTGGFMGLSFAIPSDIVQEVIAQLRSQGRVVRGWLGVLIQEVNFEEAQKLGLDRPRGAKISQVLPGSPAARAGIKNGDIVLAFNGRRLESASRLPPMVGFLRPGQKITLTVLREGRESTVNLVIAELPEQEAVAQLQNRGQQTAFLQKYGFLAKDLDEDMEKRLGVTSGVLVTQVVGDPARAANLRAGDVLLAIADTPITSVEQMQTLLESLPAGNYLLRFQRQRRVQISAIEISR
jgi:serine protease Do